MRKLVTSAVVLVAFACGGGGGGGAASTPTPEPTPTTVNVTESEFKIDLGTTTTFKAGSFNFSLTNAGTFPHDLHIAKQGTTDEIAKSTMMQKGGTTSFTTDLQKGTYTLWCGVGNHRQRGMETTITVT